MYMNPQRTERLVKLKEGAEDTPLFFYIFNIVKCIYVVSNNQLIVTFDK